MAIGATDYLEQLLVKKYALVQVDNHDEKPSKVSAEAVMGQMNDLAQMNRNMFVLSQKLNATCYAIKAMGAQYRVAPTLEALQA